MGNMTSIAQVYWKGMGLIPPNTADYFTVLPGVPSPGLAQVDVTIRQGVGRNLQMNVAGYFLQTGYPGVSVNPDALLHYPLPVFRNATLRFWPNGNKTSNLIFDNFGFSRDIAFEGFVSSYVPLF
jgi:hypothetical protein